MSRGTWTEVCRDWACFVAWADNWQTLLGAVVALPLAFFAIILPALQERGRIARHFAAMRASMPLRLTVVSHYASKAISEIAKFRRPGGVNNLAGLHFEKPELPDDLVTGLERTIEAIEDRAVVRRLSNMIAEIQVLDTRMSTLALEPPMGGNIDDNLRLAATVYAQADSLYDFARRRTDKCPGQLEWADVRRGLKLSRVYQETHPDLFAYLDRLEAKKRDPEDNEPASPAFWDFGLRLALWRAGRPLRALHWYSG